MQLRDPHASLGCGQGLQLVHTVFFQVLSIVFAVVFRFSSSARVVLLSSSLRRWTHSLIEAGLYVSHCFMESFFFAAASIGSVGSIFDERHNDGSENTWRSAHVATECCPNSCGS